MSVTGSEYISPYSLAFVAVSFCVVWALGERTKFLLADEITAMLDLITQSQIWNFLLKETSDRGIGLLVVSHSEELLKRLATRRVEWE